MLTATFPNPGGRSWMARATEYHATSDHDTSVGTMTVRCVTADLPWDALYVAQGVMTADGDETSALARLPDDYELIGGGAEVGFDEASWPASLLVGSWPGEGDDWHAAASARLAAPTPTPIVVTSYAIGLSRAFLEDSNLSVVRKQHNMPGAAKAHPATRCTLTAQLGPNGFVTGGGAVTYVSEYEPNPLNFLTETFPSTPAPHDHGWGWIGASKDHMGVDGPGWIRTYGIGVRQR